jgi:hypothetical protein
MIARSPSSNVVSVQSETSVEYRAATVRGRVPTHRRSALRCPRSKRPVCSSVYHSAIIWLWSVFGPEAVDRGLGERLQEASDWCFVVERLGQLVGQSNVLEYQLDGNPCGLNVSPERSCG